MLTKLLTQGHSIRPYYNGPSRRSHCNLHGAGRRNARDDPVRTNHSTFDSAQLRV